MSSPLDRFTVMVKQATSDLQAALRSGLSWETAVYAVPTMGKEAGQVIVTTRLDDAYFQRPAAYWPRVVRPNDNHASTFERWESVPYSAQFSVLWHALRREPILPIEGV